VPDEGLVAAVSRRLRVTATSECHFSKMRRGDCKFHAPAEALRRFAGSSPAAPESQAQPGPTKICRIIAFGLATANRPDAQKPISAVELHAFALKNRLESPCKLQGGQSDWQQVREVLLTATVLDVIDNFFARDSDLDIWRLPGKRLYELGRESRRLAEASALPKVGPGSIYLGGWPSANFWAVSGDLIMSTLLYADSVVVKDPLADWFSFNQYRVPHLMASRQGYLDPQTHSPETAHTRRFLAAVLPAVRALRPLVESGAVVFAQSADLNFSHSAAIEGLASQLMARLVTDPASYADQFAPGEIATEDNVRGMFVVAPGEQEAGVRKSLEHGMRHFAREYTLAQSVGATYTAPFRYERHLCQDGIGSAASPADRVTTALMTTELPILANLTPSVVAKVRSDDSYEEFRAQLHSVYSGLPIGAPDEEVSKYLFDQERALLAAPLKAAERELSRGLLGRLGATLTSRRFSLAAGVAVDLTLGTPGLATGLHAARTAAEGVAASRPTGP